MANARKILSVSQKNDATSINSRRGMSRRAKRNSSKKARQYTKQEIKMSLPDGKTDDTPWMEYEEESWCPTCGAPWELVRPGKSQPTCICHLICDVCGGRIAHHTWGEDPNHPNMAGDWCDKCGPFGGINNV